MTQINEEMVMEYLAEAGYEGIITNEITYVSLDAIYDATHELAQEAMLYNRGVKWVWNK